MNMLKNIFPAFVKDYIKKIIIKEYKKIEFENFIEPKKPFYCPVCKSNITHFERLDDSYLRSFDEYNFSHSIFMYETLNFLDYSCPICNSSDRVRLTTLFLNEFLKQKADSKESLFFLDIAPDDEFTKYLKNISKFNYRSADLYKEGVDDKVDIQDMNLYKDNTFDIIMCSHVLEHVENDIKAMSELYRVLKLGAIAIVMVPIMLSLDEDLENSDYVTIEQRWKYYGLDSHVRQYSKNGFITKLESVGFKVNQYGESHFGKDVFTTNGINTRSVLYVVEK